VRISKRPLLLAVSLNNKKNDDHYRWVRQSGLLATIPFLLAVPPVVGVLIGRWMDDRFSTSPLFTVVLLVFGFIAGIREVAAVLKKADADDHKKSKGS
jgi:ATP synthase protein I